MSLILEGMPTLPMVIFSSGDMCFLIRHVPIRREGEDKTILYLMLTEKVKERYNITDDELNFSMSPEGVYIKEYPTAYVRWRCQDPENGLLDMECTFMGQETMDSDIALLTSEIRRYKQLINTMKAENQHLQEALKEAGERIISNATSDLNGN